ncbi:site-specific integrase [Kitasatospora terrestris]|uniref:Site-specific integrase n=1 Tax=Kitasatospora terrestris TaxID=258051 RepID=A0ABP9E1T8_9ACTN
MISIPDTRSATPADTNDSPALSGAAQAAMAAGIPDSTKRAYSGDWQRFTDWCTAHGRTPLPATPETLIEYVTVLTTQPRPDTGRPYAPSSIERAIASIRTAHRAANLLPPETKGARLVLRGYTDARARSKDPQTRARKASPALPDSLRAMLDTLDRDSLAGKRDAALLLLGFATAGRVSELVALDLADLQETDEGLLVSMYRGKVRKLTDVAVPYGSNPSSCPVRAVRSLVAAMGEAGREAGPLFVRVDRHGRVAPPMLRRGVPIGDPEGRLTSQAAAQVVERVADAAGLVGQWTGHSLRRGFATAARKAGHDMLTIGRHGGWEDGSKALLGYFEQADQWQENALHRIGL